MQPIQINVSVNIGFTQELCGFINTILSNRQNDAKTQVCEPPTTTEQPAALAETPTEKAATAKPSPEPQAEAEVTAQQPTKEYSEVDVRAAMERTRRRIEGENYKDQTDSEGYKKWHRALTSWFKCTAAAYGAEKPSALADSNSRAEFIRSCDAVYVKDGELTEDCPF